MEWETKSMLGDPTDEVEEQYSMRGGTGSKPPKTDFTGDIWKKPTFRSGRGWANINFFEIL